jgi:hypothetical protein
MLPNLHGGHFGDGGKYQHVANPDNQVAPYQTRSASVCQAEHARPILCVRIFQLPYQT